jgi:HAD superfamily hydrolase (TIGR01484 family)
MSQFDLLLCTDLDRTLLPNGTQSESPQARQLFSKLALHPTISLVYVSGRHQRLIERAINNYRLPRPDFVISDVGTNIYDLREGDWRVWSQWQKEIALDWKGYQQRQLSKILRDISELRLQQLRQQNTFKLSYYVSLHADQSALQRTLTNRFSELGIEASLIWSMEEPAGVGLLDILPKRATKLHAIEFLQADLGVATAATLFAGDSSNDLPVLASSVPAVLVANATSTVTGEALAAAAEAGNQQQLYVARGDFLNMNGNYSAGILEGVAHFHPELAALFTV